MLTQDHRTDGREWRALSDEVAEKAEYLVQYLHVRQELRNTTDREFLNYALRKVRHPSVGDLRLTIDLLCAFQNNVHVEVPFKTIYEHVLRLRSEDLSAVESLTAETYSARRVIMSLVGLMDGEDQWFRLIKKRPADAQRIVEIVRDRDVQIDAAIAILDEMDKQHPALREGVL